MASVKMKSTCNACAVAKVKCSREKPVCSRCNERGLKCHYDPSQRSGRRPAKPSDAQNTFDLSETLADSSNGFQFGDNFLFNTEPSTTSWGSTAAGSTRSSTAATSLKDFMEDYSFDMQHGPSRNEEMDFGGMLDAASDAMDVQFPFNQLDSSTHTPSDPDVSPQWLLDPNISSDLQSMINAASKPKSQDVGCHSSSRQKTCLMRLLRILPSLETKPVGSNEPAPLLDQLNDNIATTLSRIVERNSAVLYVVDDMLNCECLVHDRQCLIVGLIVTKVLAWYEAVIAGRDTCDSSTSGLKTSLSCQESWTGISTNCQSNKKLKTSVPTTNVGSYPLDKGGNTRMRAQLVLSELRHVLRTLNRWSQRHQETSRSVDTFGHMDSRGYGSAMCVLIEADLRAALQTCSREAMKSLH